MRAVQLVARGTLEARDLPIPEPGPGELLVRVRATGICETDVHIYHRDNPPRLPLTLGHEFAGEVAASGPGCKRFGPGDRIVADPNVTCGNCRYCQMGRPNLCRSLRHLGMQIDGSDAEYVVVPERNAYRMPDVSSFEAAALTEPFSCAMHAMTRLRLQPDEDVLIIGDGFFGQAYAQLARALGAGRVVAFGRSEAKLERAREQGADFAVDERAPEADEIARSLTEGLGPAAIIDTIGAGATFERAADLAAPGARIAFFGATGDQSGALTRRILGKELDVLGSLSSSGAWEATIDLLSKGALNPQALLTQVVDLSQLDEAFALKADPNSGVTKLVARV